MSFNLSDGQSEIKGDFSRLENLIKDLEGKHSVDVGVFKDAKTPDGQQVAEYGAKNEFGTVTKPVIPHRSFIRMPIETKSEKIEAYTIKHMKEHLENSDVKAVFDDIGIGAESVIGEAFDTRGFGTWAPNAPYTIEQKGTDTPLIWDGLLRRSITSRSK